MAGYGSIGNTTPPGGRGGSGVDSEEERDSIRTPLVLPKPGRRGMRRQPASQVNPHL